LKNFYSKNFIFTIDSIIKLKWKLKVKDTFINISIYFIWIKSVPYIITRFYKAYTLIITWVIVGVNERRERELGVFRFRVGIYTSFLLYILGFFGLVWVFPFQFSVNFRSISMDILNNSIILLTLSLNLQLVFSICLKLEKDCTECSFNLQLSCWLYIVVVSFPYGVYVLVPLTICLTFHVLLPLSMFSI
jgi:hypothetical protein